MVTGSAVTDKLHAQNFSQRQTPPTRSRSNPWDDHEARAKYFARDPVRTRLLSSAEAVRARPACDRNSRRHTRADSPAHQMHSRAPTPVPARSHRPLPAQECHRHPRAAAYQASNGKKRAADRAPRPPAILRDAPHRRQANRQSSHANPVRRDRANKKRACMAQDVLSRETSVRTARRSTAHDAADRALRARPLRDYAACGANRWWKRQDGNLRLSSNAMFVRTCSESVARGCQRGEEQHRNRSL